MSLEDMEHICNILGKGVSVRNQRHVYLVNVGVNSSHKLRSPIFPDGRFEFIPIQEEYDIGQCTRGDIAPITYNDLYCYNSPQKLLSLFPEKIQDKYRHCIVHYDPNLKNHNDTPYATFTYGDIPFLSPRAANLRNAQPGDLLFFLANLACYDSDKPQFIPGQRALYFIGFIEIDLVLEYSVDSDHAGKLRSPGSKDNQTYHILKFTRNAHINRLLTLPGKYAKQPFTIFEGSNRSRRFDHAVPITRQICDSCLRDKDCKSLDYEKFKTLNACIGAYTRSVRPHFKLDNKTDEQRFQLFLECIANLNDIPNLL